MNEPEIRRERATGDADPINVLPDPIKVKRAPVHSTRGEAGLRTH